MQCLYQNFKFIKTFQRSHIIVCPIVLYLVSKILQAFWHVTLTLHLCEHTKIDFHVCLNCCHAKHQCFGRFSFYLTQSCRSLCIAIFMYEHNLISDILLGKFGWLVGILEDTCEHTRKETIRDFYELQGNNIQLHYISNLKYKLGGLLLPFFLEQNNSWTYSIIWFISMSVHVSSSVGKIRTHSISVSIFSCSSINVCF